MDCNRVADDNSCSQSGSVFDTIMFDNVVVPEVVPLRSRINEMPPADPRHLLGQGRVLKQGTPKVFPVGPPPARNNIVN